MKRGDEQEAGRAAGAVPSREVRRRRLRRLRTVRRWTTGVLLVLGALVAVAGVVVLQTAPGQRAALDFALEQIEGSLAGELRIGTIRSRTLLAGASLDDVVLTDDTGRPVLTADSVVVRYLPTGLVSGALRIRSVILWGMDLEISTLSEDGELNLGRVLAPGDPAPDSARTRIDLVFGQIGVRSGRVSVLSPASGDLPIGAGGVVPGPEGPLARIGLDGMSLDLEDAVLSIDGDVAFRSDLASLAMRLALPGTTEPMVVRESFGRLTFDLDEGLSITEAAFRLPQTLGRGTVELGPVAGVEGWALEADLEVEDWGSLSDIRWADARIPEGTFRGGVRVSTVDGLALDLAQVDVRLSDTNLALDGDVVFGDVLSTRDLDIVASPLVLSRISPWLPEPLPVDGWLSGRATLTGTREDLRADGRVTFVPVGHGGAPTTADFGGRMHLGSDPGWTDFEARVEPLNYAVVDLFAPGVAIDGRGSADIQLDGRTRLGVRVIADLVHQDGTSPESRVNARGTFGRSADGWTLDLSGDVMPLSLEVAGALRPDLELRGEVRGPVTARGPLTDLRLTADLEGPGGRLSLDGALDVTDPASAYRLDFEAVDLALAAYSGRLPDPTLWNGTLSVDGSGLTLDSLRGTASLRLRGSRIGGLRVDTVAAALRAEDGLLHWESMEGSVGGVHFEGSGRLGLSGEASGDASLRFYTESLVGLRPLLMGDSIIVGDELTSLEQEMLRLEGVEPDTLPTAEEVRMEGAVRGMAELSGLVTDFAVDLRMTMIGGAYGRSSVDSMEVAMSATGLPGMTGLWEADIDATGLLWEGRTIHQLAVTGSLQDRSGSGEVHMTRRESESYTLAGDFQLDSVGGEAHLTEMVATLEERTWSMARPTWISWTADVLGVEDLEVIREGDDPMRLTAAGTLAREGESDFQLDVDGLHLERLGAMLRNDPLDIAGHLDLRVRVRGPAPAPLIDAELEIEDPRFRNMTLSRVEGTMSYRDRAAAMTLGAWDGERQALTASGTVPVDLSLGEVASRRLDEPMDLVLAADSLDAGLALAYFGSLEDVVGVISADVQLRGTTENPIPSGQVRLEDGAWTMEALGVRHRNVSGSLDLREDQTVTVDLSTTGTGTSTVTGTIRLSPLDDPSLDLTVSFDRFRAMERRDIEGTLSGDLTVTGTYQRPLTEGTLTVDEGLLQVDEFSRAAGVVDLSDPRLFSQGLAVDTTVFMSQRILADIRNPFLDNLRLNVNLSVPRNTWLRSNEMNVEMGGDLLVRYDRSAGDLVLVGELQALRGTYLVLGRTFEVDEGIVSFIGRPGINPSLDIAAVSRFRTSEGGQVAITATVDGTLVQPRVTLTSEAGELSQSDLISYLVFNQSAAEVGRAQQSFLGQATGGAAATAVSGVVTFGLGSFVNQSGAAIAQELSLDYVAVSSGPASAEWAGLRSAQLELGRYLGDDVFAVVTFRPLIEEASRFGGVRIEWALTDVYNFEAFVEDRFLRSGVGFLGIQELGGELLYGVLFAREWSYNQ
jgi:hypothetical protein